MEEQAATGTASDFGKIMDILATHGRLENVIEVKYLVKNYGSFTAVCGVSFNVRRGEVFALLGPNGAGKTTIVEILELLKTPTRGYVSIFGNAVLTGIPAGNIFMGADQNYSGIKERIGVLPQSSSAFDLLTVYENIDYFAQIYSSHVSVDRLVEEFDLKEKRNTLYKNLSGGLKQRVGIALALVNDPDIVFLDEPSSGLDPRSRRDVWDAIKKLKARGKTIVLTTHYMDEAYNLADRICIIHKGAVVAEGTPEELIYKYGGRSTLIIRECDTEARDRLVKELPDSAVAGNDVLVKLPEGDGMATMLKTASIMQEGGFKCREIYVNRSTLDDVFLNLTGEQLHEGEP
jgi:ABC-2 type transport system ATP-binding protein